MLVAVLVATGVPALDAQTAMLTGTVIRGSAGEGLGGAEVSLPSLGRTTTTNYIGEFRLDRLPAGRFAVTVRRLGDDNEMPDALRAWFGEMLVYAHHAVH